MSKPRDHGGGIDAARAVWGGDRTDWLDLSTGINPVPYPVPDIPGNDWTALPDRAAFDRLEVAARTFWNIPDTLDILPASGASALIAALPGLARRGAFETDHPTYNEHAASFEAHGWQRGAGGAFVAVHPNNPDGRVWQSTDIPTDRPLTVIDESFCDVMPEMSLVALGDRADTIILKSFGKFWGLAGLRLGFAIGRSETIAPLRDRIGPWAVSGPALRVAAQALEDVAWAAQTRTRLADDAAHLDRLTTRAGWETVGGTSLFRLYSTPSAVQAQDTLASHRIWSRIFPYSDSWVRLGLPGSKEDWVRLSDALAAA